MTTYRSRNPGIDMITLGLEETAFLKFLKQAIVRQGGSITAIQFEKSGITSITREGRIYSFDPTKIFTRRGLYASLLAEGSFSDQATIDSLSSTADRVLNNYLAKSKSRIIVELAEAGNQDGEIVVSDKCLQQLLREKKINSLVVKETLPDDGSLHARAIQDNIPYIRITPALKNRSDLPQIIKVLKEIIVKHCLPHNSP